MADDDAGPHADAALAEALYRQSLAVRPVMLPSYMWYGHYSVLFRHSQDDRHYRRRREFGGTEADR
ncbi:MAG: hypothetical protein KGJ79_09635 [Alphaproteobacteria bacterium]|nr:hypothetical protein [Alphaproteobacteria bacterium]MDE2111392.1 hypothetical protein [Alphaproteobacteria bacterium]MDE2495555.1 hypothetical protein [Alphaproteobacteria bacterium]